MQDLELKIYNLKLDLIKDLKTIIYIWTFFLPTQKTVEAVFTFARVILFRLIWKLFISLKPFWFILNDLCSRQQKKMMERFNM